MTAAFRQTLAASLWLAAGGVLTVSVLALGGRYSATLDILTHPAPVSLALAALIVLVAPFAPVRRRGLLAALALIAAGANLVLLAPELLAARAQRFAPADAPGQIKVIQFNAWTGNVDPQRALDWLVAQDADVIVLEEGKRITDRLLAAGYHAACRGCGALIFTRHRLVWTSGRPPRDVRTDYLGAATIEDGQARYTVVGVHRAWPIYRVTDYLQGLGLADYLARFPKARLILAGDFNSTPWSFARRREDRAFGLERRTRALATWPAGEFSHNRLPAPVPYLPIDHIYAGAGWATVKVERGPRLGSDHYPVIVTLAPVGGPDMTKISR